MDEDLLGNKPKPREKGLTSFMCCRGCQNRGCRGQEDITTKDNSHKYSSMSCHTDKKQGRFLAQG